MTSTPYRSAAVVALSLLSFTHPATAAEPAPLKKDKLQIVFLMGQSNMVGMADIGTACYLAQPQYTPPREVILKKTESFDWNNLYWQGVRYYQGPHELEKKLESLVDSRETLRSLWRSRVNGKNWNPQWGEKPVIKNRDDMYAFLDKKLDEAGIYQDMAKILDGPENRFPMEKAYEEVTNRDKSNAEQIQRVRDIFLNSPENRDFDAFLAGVNEAKKSKNNSRTPEETRRWVAELGKKSVGLPIAKHNYIFDHGAFASSDAVSNTEATAQGPLSIGWGAGPTLIGPEYAVGITLERLVDAPILLVKCAWGNTAVREAWRPDSLDGIETPAEKAQREAWNAGETANAKEEGREPKLREAKKKRDKLSWSWSMAMPAVKKVLENPGAYHPEYDPEKGYDIAGMVWFQGYSDIGNQAYGEQLEEMFKWFRKEINAPNMPIVCGTVGVGQYNHTAFKGEVNGGMVQAAESPALKGSVDVVNTARYFPHELQMLIQTLNSMDKKSPEFNQLKSLHEKINSNQGFHYYGSAKFHLLAGDAFARSLANMMAGGKPAILDEANTTK